MMKLNKVAFLMLGISIGSVLLSPTVAIAVETKEIKEEKIIEQTHEKLEEVVLDWIQSGDTEREDIDELLREVVPDKAIEIVKDEVAALDDKVVDEITDGLYVNDMLLEAENNMQNIQKQIDEAKERGEKLYTTDEILLLSPETLKISAEELSEIKGMILTNKIDEAIISATSEHIGGETEISVTELSQKMSEFLIPESMINIEKEDTGNTGEISGGGWPYCEDDNGWGPANFVSSDCYVVLYFYGHCLADFTPWRYCKANQRNCSPVLGHSKYHHTHSAAWQALMW